MRRFVLDTCVVLASLKGHDDYYHVKQDLDLGNSDVAILVPFAVKAELLSLALQRNYGAKKLKGISDLIDESFVMYPNEEIIDIYSKIDAYSQGKLNGFPLSKGDSAHNMGKNDLWIAATAVAVKATTVTFDSDFDHLKNVTIENFTIDVKHYQQS